MYNRSTCLPTSLSRFVSSHVLLLLLCVLLLLLAALPGLWLLVLILILLLWAGNWLSLLLDLLLLAAGASVWTWVVVVVVVWLDNLLSQLLFAFVDVGVEFVAVLPNRKLLVVVDWDVNFPVAVGLVLRIVELGHIRVSQRLLCGQSLVWIEL